ncbi:hypothetical protein PG987_015046 [Apiospora arundinis]
MDSQLLADYLAQKTSRFGSDLSPVELADLYISPISIEDTTSWQEPRNLEKLPEFLEKFAKEPEKLKKAPQAEGIASHHHYLRCWAESRRCRQFAKHIKLEEASKNLKEHRTGMAVGTPARLNDLVENGSLSLANLERLVVDASHIDQKKRGVLDMKDTLMPLVRWLARKEFKEKYAATEKPLQLLFY